VLRRGSVALARVDCTVTDGSAVPSCARAAVPSAATMTALAVARKGKRWV